MGWNKGNGAYTQLEVSTDGQTFIAIDGLNDVSKSPEATEIDVSTFAFDKSGHKLAGNPNYSVEFSGYMVYDTTSGSGQLDPGQKILKEALRNGTKLWLKVKQWTDKTQGTITNQFLVEGQPTGFAEGTPNNEGITLSVPFAIASVLLWTDGTNAQAESLLQEATATNVIVRCSVLVGTDKITNAIAMIIKDGATEDPLVDESFPLEPTNGDSVNTVEFGNDPLKPLTMSTNYLVKIKADVEITPASEDGTTPAATETKTLHVLPVQTQFTATVPLTSAMNAPKNTPKKDSKESK